MGLTDNCEVKMQKLHRLTLNKPVTEMSIVELAHNMFFGRYREAMYRDFEKEITCRDVARRLVERYCPEDFSKEFFEDKETFDEEIFDSLQYDISDIRGMIALFYASMWAQADLYETLKAYENLGVTPEQIREIDKLYRKKCEELNKL